MSIRRSLVRWGVWLAAPLTILFLWAWHVVQEPDVVAEARVLLPQGSLSRIPSVDSSRPAGHDSDGSLRRPEILQAAHELLHQRFARGELATIADFNSNDFRDRLSIRCASRADQDEIVFGYQSGDPELAQGIVGCLAQAAVDWLHNSLPPASDARRVDRETEQSQLAEAIKRQRDAAARLSESLGELEVDGEGQQSDGELESLTAALNQARVDRLDAEVWLSRVQQKVELGSTAEELAQELSASPLAGAVRELLDRGRWQSELETHEANLKSALAIYGRNHPRLIRMQGDYERHRRLFEASEVSRNPVRTVSAEGELDPAAVEGASKSLVERIVALLEDQHHRAASDEEQAGQSLAALSERFNQRQELSARLGEVTQEQQFLESEQDRVREELNEGERQMERLRPRLAAAPELLAEPVVPPVPASSAWILLGSLIASGGASVALRRFDRRQPAAGSSVTHAGKMSSDSQQAERLARLRRLSSRT